MWNPTSRMKANEQENQGNKNFISAAGLISSSSYKPSVIDTRNKDVNALVRSSSHKTLITGTRKKETIAIVSSSKPSVTGTRNKKADVLVKASGHAPTVSGMRNKDVNVLVGSSRHKPSVIDRRNANAGSYFLQSQSFKNWNAKEGRKYNFWTYFSGQARYGLNKNSHLCLNLFSLKGKGVLSDISMKTRHIQTTRKIISQARNTQIGS